MNRPIEYRVWDRQNNEFVAISNQNCIWDTNPEDGNIWVFNARYCLQEFTGLRDKNGEKIFEGDIVKSGILQGIVEPPNRLNLGTWSFRGFTLFAYDNVTVIGNVFENPELLK